MDLDLLRRWSRDLIRIRPDDRAATLQSIRDVKARKKVEQAPPPVAASEGWSPYLAKAFLDTEGLPTGDYHPSYDDEWFAASRMVEIGDGLMPDNLAYYVDGDERAARG